MDYENMSCEQIATVINDPNTTPEERDQATFAFTNKGCDTHLLSGDNGPPPPHP